MLRGTLLIARLTWLETRRRRIALAALVCGSLFVAVFATAIHFGFRAEGVDTANAVELRLAATILTVAGLYVVNFLVVAVAILLPIDSLSGEISSGVIQTLASKPVDRAAIVLGKWLAYLAMTAAYLAVSELARKRGLYMRDAAYIIAIDRVARACHDRGWV